MEKSNEEAITQRLNKLEKRSERTRRDTGFLIKRLQDIFDGLREKAEYRVKKEKERFKEFENNIDLLSERIGKLESTEQQNENIKIRGTERGRR